MKRAGKGRHQLMNIHWYPVNKTNILIYPEAGLGLACLNVDYLCWMEATLFKASQKIGFAAKNAPENSILLIAINSTNL